MPRSRTTPSPYYFFILLCLAVMVFTAVRIWNQSPDGWHKQVASTEKTITLPGESPTPGKTPVVKPFRSRQYSAEIRADVVLAQSHANIEPPTEVELPLPTDEAPLLLGPSAVDIPMALQPPSLQDFDLNRTRQGLEVPPEMVMPPMQPSAEFTADVATPALDRITVEFERTQPMMETPSTVAAPRSPATIAAESIPAEPTEPIVATTEPAPTVAIVEENVTEEESVADPQSLPLPPIRTVVSDDDPPIESGEPVAIAPELPPLAPSLPIDVAESPAPSLPPETPISAPPTETLSTQSPASLTSTPPTNDVRDAVAEARRAARTKSARHGATDGAGDSRSPWPTPVALRKEIARLDELRVQAGTEQIVQWASQVAATLDALQTTHGLNTVDTKPQLGKLRYLVENTPQVNDSRIQSRVMVARYAVQRRLAVWNAMQIAMQPDVTTQIKQLGDRADGDTLVRLTRTIRQGLGQGSAAENWNQFLMLDEVERLAASDSSRSGAERASVAARLLERMNRASFTPVQLSVVQSPNARQLQGQLRNWSTANMDYRQWLAAIEHLETNPSFRESDGLADMATQLKWSYSKAQNQLASTFYSHYRNANARLAVTELMLNRMLPIIRESRAPIREEILGARVFGNSATWTKIGLDLVPDNQRLRMKLVANGNVNAQTRSYAGPAVVFNRNQSHFHLQKMITCDQRGVHIGKSSTTATTKLKVLGLRTEYDGVPFIGSIARRKVQQQVNEQRNLAKRVIDRRVASQAQSMVDTQLTQQLFAVQQQAEEKLVQPLRKLQLDPTTISLQTTNNRMVYRGRLAAEHHLAAFTPRPNALANSVVSLQLHESAINNAIERMHIDGRRGDLRQMLEAAVNSRPKVNFQIPDDVPDGVTLQLADQDAIRMRWQDGSMRISIRVAEIAFKRRSWKNFTVSANYRPKAAGLEAELYRDGVVELVGKKRLSMRDQVALRGIFGKVFSKNRNIPLMPADLAKDRRLSDLHVTQFTIRDGWVGVSIGRRVPNVARQRGRQNYRR